MAGTYYGDGGTKDSLLFGDHASTHKSGLRRARTTWTTDPMEKETSPIAVKKYKNIIRPRTVECNPRTDTRVIFSIRNTDHPLVFIARVHWIFDTNRTPVVEYNRFSSEPSFFAGRSKWL